jgi:TctA family transporter
MSFGSLTIFVERPICAAFLVLTVVWIAVIPWLLRKRAKLASLEEETL